MIPPKLKILAGFKSDEDVTIDQIIAALEKRSQKQPKTQISNQTGRSFRLLLHNRAQEFPNESYDQQWTAVAKSDEGARLLAQMKRAEGDASLLSNAISYPIYSHTRPAEPGEKYDPQVEAEAREKFLNMIGQRALGDMAGQNDARIWNHTSLYHPVGRKLHETWKRQIVLRKLENR